MKLRQKLAVVLAASMVVTAVPVVTMASSTNKVVNPSTIIEKDKTTTASAITVEFDQEPNEIEEFYLELTNAEWLKGDDDKVAKWALKDSEKWNCLDEKGKVIAKDVTTKFYVIDKDTWVTLSERVQITYKRQSDSTMRITMSSVAGTVTDGVKYNLPLPIKAKGGEVKVKVVGNGNSSVTEGELKIMSTGEKAATLTVDKDLESFYDAGKLTKIILAESFERSFQKGMVVKVELNNNDYEFRSKSIVKAKGTYGFNFGEVELKKAIDPDDKGVMYVYIPGSLVKGDRNSLGKIEITGLEVDSDENELSEGKFTADIKSVGKYTDLSEKVRDELALEALDKTDNGTDIDFSALDKDYNSIDVATIANYSAVIEMKDSKAKDIKAGRQEDVEFTVKESIDDVFSGGATISLTLQDSDGKQGAGFFMIKSKVFKDAEDNAQSDDVIKAIDDGDGDSTKIIKSVEFVPEDKDDVKNNVKEADRDYWQEQYADDKDGMVRVKEIKITLADTKDKNAKTDDKKYDKEKQLHLNGDKDKFKIKVPVYVPVDKQDKKTIKVVGETRKVNDFKSADAINVIDPFDVTFTQTTLKVGLQDQIGGNITLKELDKAMLEKGKVEFSITKGSDLNGGIKIDDKGELTVTGDLKKTDFDKKDNKDYVELKRQSKSASTLSIDNLQISVDRTVPEGTYDLELSGDAIDKYNGTYTVEKYIVIGTANPGDLANANGLAAVTAVFTIDSTKYTVNGVEQDMDAPAYIAGSGSTMIPMRYLAYAFGVAPENILFSNGTATFFAGSRTIQLTSGSDTALVNGAPIKMAVKVENKNGRLFVPVGEVANILGVKKSWDSATKTATFSNVNTTK